MNKFKQIRKGLLFVLATLSFSSCVHDDDYAVPPIAINLPCNPEWAADTGIADLIALNPDGVPLEITDDLILEGYVVSSDENGNFFKSLVIQDDPANPTSGMTIEMDLYDTYRKFPVGYKVLVNAKGLYFGRDHASYKIGTTYVDNNGNVRIGRMTEVRATSQVALSCEDPSDIAPVVFTSIQDLKDNAVVNTLIRLENVQFDELTEGDTYYDESSGNTFGGATNRTLIDETGSKIVLRTSKYTDFGGEALPTGSGSIIAVLSAYSNNNNPTPSTYQLFIRSVDDVDMDDPRFGDTPDSGNGDTALTETFDEGIPSNWKNIAVVGDRKWQEKEYDGSHHVQNSAYSATGIIDMKSWLITSKINFDTTDDQVLTVKLADAYSNGMPIKIMYSTDYDGTANPTSASWTEIGSSELAALDENTEIYDNIYQETTPIDLTDITGQGYIAFVYDSADGTISTTIQISDVMIN